MQSTTNNTKILRFQGLENVLKYDLNLVSSSGAKVFCVYHVEKVTILLGGNLYNCTNGGYILSKYVCDGYVDCANDKSDETVCICGVNTLNKNSPSLCKVQRNTTQVACSTLYYMAVDGKCKNYIDITEIYCFKNNFLLIEFHTFSKISKAKCFVKETSIAQSFKSLNFICSDGKSLNTIFINDLVADCMNAEDEPTLKALLINRNHLSFPKPYEIPCFEGHSKCYAFSDTYV